MSMFDWFKRKQQIRKTAVAASSGLGHVDATRPIGRRRNAKPVLPPRNTEPSVPSESAKEERAGNRELLFGVVRESMVRAGVLSSSYKFKVLSLDQRGKQFLVMMDLAREYAGEPDRMAEIEALIAQRAKGRYDIFVKGVYWRVNEHVALGRPEPALVAKVAAGAALTPAAVAPVVPQPQIKPPKYDPIDADEVNAFRSALESGTPVPKRDYPEFADTEALKPLADAEGLSTTQYGDLN
jgi:hypothetical protein